MGTTNAKETPELPTMELERIQNEALGDGGSLVVPALEDAWEALGGPVRPLGRP